jgi:hypothetical protein
MGVSGRAALVAPLAGSLQAGQVQPAIAAHPSRPSMAEGVVVMRSGVGFLLIVYGIYGLIQPKLKPLQAGAASDVVPDF